MEQVSLLELHKLTRWLQTLPADVQTKVKNGSMQIMFTFSQTGVGCAVLATLTEFTTKGWLVTNHIKDITDYSSF